MIPRTAVYLGAVPDLEANPGDITCGNTSHFASNRGRLRRWITELACARIGGSSRYGGG